MPQEIVIEIDEDGNVQIEGNGFKGTECVTLTQDLENELGEVEKRDFKTEYRQTKPATRTRTR